MRDKGYMGKQPLPLPSFSRNGNMQFAAKCTFSGLCALGEGRFGGIFLRELGEAKIISRHQCDGRGLREGTSVKKN